MELITRESGLMTFRPACECIPDSFVGSANTAIGKNILLA